MGEAALFGRTARSFVSVVGQVGSEQWDAPGLGVWSVRSLVGHTARAILTVENYLQADEPGTVSIDSAEAYYATVFEQYTDHKTVAVRGVEAGLWLGDAPVMAVKEALGRTLELIDAQPPGRLVSIGGMGITLHEYLRTRIFELTVHTMDICAATGAKHDLPLESISASAALAAGIAVAKGRGKDLLFALTGRAPLPEGFSVV